MSLVRDGALHKRDMTFRRACLGETVGDHDVYKPTTVEHVYVLLDRSACQIKIGWTRGSVEQRKILAVAALLAFASTASAQGYRYHGIRLQRGPVTLELDTAHAPNGHVAVWFGANDDRGHWVQAGIAVQAGSGQPFLYLETTRYGKPTIQVWPTRLHHTITVRVVSKRGRWAVTADGHRSPFVWLNNPTIDSMLETLGTASGTAQVDQQHLTGGSL